MKKEGGSALAIVFGKKKGGMENPPAPDMEADEGDYSIPPDFEDEAIKFMPELEGDPARMEAFWRAVKACVGG